MNTVSPSTVRSALPEKPDVWNEPPEKNNSFVVHDAVVRASERLHLIINAPERWTVESVLASIGSLAAAFHDQLCAFDKGNNVSQGWIHESWGPDMKTLNDKGYLLSAESLLRVTEATMNRLATEGSGKRRESLEKNIKEGLFVLQCYQKSHMPVDGEFLNRLLVRFQQQTTEDSSAA